MMRASCGHAAPELRSAILADVHREDGGEMGNLTNGESVAWRDLLNQSLRMRKDFQDMR